jgi:hypothetical protein
LIALHHLREPVGVARKAYNELGIVVAQARAVGAVPVINRQVTIVIRVAIVHDTRRSDTIRLIQMRQSIGQGSL